MNVYFYYIYSLTEFEILEWLAVAVVEGAFILWIWSRLILSDAYTIGAQAKSLVTKGPYKIIRHPIYLASAGVMAGFILFTQIWPLIGVAVILILVQNRRAVAEQKVLLKEFGNEYQQYLNQTWF